MLFRMEGDCTRVPKQYSVLLKQQGSRSGATNQHRIMQEQYGQWEIRMVYINIYTFLK